MQLLQLLQGTGFHYNCAKAFFRSSKKTPTLLFTLRSPSLNFDTIPSDHGYHRDKAQPVQRTEVERCSRDLISFAGVDERLSPGASSLAYLQLSS
jgi:hypothetical protein